MSQFGFANTNQIIVLITVTKNTNKRPHHGCTDKSLSRRITKMPVSACPITNKVTNDSLAMSHGAVFPLETKMAVPIIIANTAAGPARRVKIKRAMEFYACLILVY